MRLLCFFESRNEQTEVSVRSIARGIGFRQEDIVFVPFMRTSETAFQIGDVTMLYASIEDEREMRHAKNALTWLSGKHQTPVVCIEEFPTTAGGVRQIVDMIGTALLPMVFGGANSNLREMLAVRREQNRKCSC